MNQRACRAMCQQGRQECKTPDVCELAEEDHSIGWGAFIPAFLSMALVGLCAAIALLLKDFT
jgi:hypothetical protein